MLSRDGQWISKFTVWILHHHCMMKGPNQCLCWTLADFQQSFKLSHAQLQTVLSGRKYKASLYRAGLNCGGKPIKWLSCPMHNKLLHTISAQNVLSSWKVIVQIGRKASRRERGAPIVVTNATYDVDMTQNYILFVIVSLWISHSFICNLIYSYTEVHLQIYFYFPILQAFAPEETMKEQISTRR